MLDTILNPHFWNSLLLGIAITTPIVAGIICIAARSRFREFIRLEVFWILAFSGPLFLLLWHVFNAIENRFGLDSVLAMLINLTFFSAVGLGTSVLLKRSARKIAGRIPGKDV